MYCASCGVEGKEKLFIFPPNRWHKWKRGGISFYLCERCDRIYWRKISPLFGRVTTSFYEEEDNS